jgi:flavin reductase (DIM6/NTAB) family NADH-FMN oxidoreductase RutF
MILKENDILQMDQRYRATLINSLAGFRQAVLVGTRSVNGCSNLAIFNSLIHLGASPALYGLISRPDTVRKDTLQNILDTKEYTLNYVQKFDFKKAHQTSAKYEACVSEFEKVGFTEAYLSDFLAPFVEEAVVKIGMKFEDQIDIQINGTILIVGSLQSIQLNQNILGNDGFVALGKENILVSCGLDGYYSTEFLGRLNYAKPDNWSVEL